VTVRIINADVMERLRERSQDRVYLLAEALQVCMDRCAESPTPEGWDWASKKHFRFPPLPHYYRRPVKGHCRICWLEAGKVTWHRECAAAYNFMTSPDSSLLGWLQDFICPGCGDAIGYARRYERYDGWSPWDFVISGDCEADHVIPLYQVRRGYAGQSWVETLRFWSPLNLQALCRSCHVRKCASEAAERAAFRLHGRSDAPLFAEVQA
jgi:hypothetical protein